MIGLDRMAEIVDERNRVQQSPLRKRFESRGVDLDGATEMVAILASSADPPTAALAAFELGMVCALEAELERAET